MVGNAGGNILDGGAERDLIFGAGGADTLLGGAGNDVLTGGLGNDSLVGGADIDVLEGGLGADTLSGGIGNDVFRWRAADPGAVNLVLDFVQGQDRIDLSLIDAQPFTPAVNDAFVLVASHTIGTQGEVTQALVNGRREVQVYIDGDAVADIVIRLDNAVPPTLVASNFVL